MPVILNFFHWLSAVLLIILSFYCLKKANTRTGYYLCVFLLLLSGWCLTSALIFTASSLATKIELARIKFIFIPFIPVNVFFLVRCFSDNEKVTWPTLIGLLSVPVISVLITLSPYYTLMSTNYRLETFFGSTILTFDNGSWFPIHLIHSRILFIWALVLLVKTSFTNYLIRRTCWIIFFSLLIPFMLDSMAIILYPVMRFIQIVPIALTFSAVCFYYVIFKEKVLELIPIARNMVIDSIPDIYLVIDYREQLVDFNLHAKKILNLNNSSFGLKLKNIKSDQKGILEHLLAMLWNEQSDGEFEAKGQFPKEFYSIKFEKIISKTSELIGKVIVIKNISEQKKYEAQLTQTVETRTKFIGLMAHDLIGNVSGHALFLESLLDHDTVNKDPDLKASVDFLLHSSQNVTKFVEGLLAWSRENLDEIQLKKASTDINHMVSDSINFLEAISIQKDIEYELHIPPGTLANVDPDMIQTVFRNIIANAVKLSPPNGTIVIGAEVNDSIIEISIADEGPGVNEEELNKFLNGLTIDTYKGGLGLTLSRDFIHMHNGRISVKNKLPKGAIFTFSLPVLNS